MTASEGEESNPLADEVAPPPKRKGPQRRAATSRKFTAEHAGDEIESDDPEKREDDVDLKSTKSRKIVAENNSGTKARTTQKSKKADPKNVSVLRFVKIECSMNSRLKRPIILRSEWLILRY